ncbi:hypothetical protein CKY20_03450 [Capnocytophaga canis]|uniref:YbjN domain-containing protein n=2 Tax=Capnocytophaga canis TaxID=1848903 RepID=A0A3A1YHX2_9FLAO|nr:hypothetical protein CKY20_03450 [Capnocytophaga canis]
MYFPQCPYSVNEIFSENRGCIIFAKPKKIVLLLLRKQIYMRNRIPKYHRPIKNINDPIAQVDSWYAAVDAFEEKRYSESLRKLLDYINPEVAKQVPASGDFSVEYPQGSSRVTFGVRNDYFYIESPFVKITEKSNKIALLREVNELNFTHLTIPQIHLENQMLWFKFEAPLYVCQPNKIYEALREICETADDFDDEFIEKYNVEYVQSPVIEHLNEEEKQQAWEKIQSILDEYKLFMDYFQEKRWSESQWDILMISLLQLGNMPCIQGVLRVDLQEYIQNISNNRIDFHYRIDRGRNFFKKLMEKSQEDLMKDIYYTKALMGLKWRSSSKIIQEYVTDFEEQIRKYKNSNDHFNVAYYLNYIYLRLMYFYNLDQNYKDFIIGTLERASGEAYEKAATIYLETFDHLLNETLPKNIKNGTTTKKGFLARLFG